MGCRLCLLSRVFPKKIGGGTTRDNAGQAGQSFRRPFARFASLARQSSPTFENLRHLSISVLVPCPSALPIRANSWNSCQSHPCLHKRRRPTPAIVLRSKIANLKSKMCPYPLFCPLLFVPAINYQPSIFSRPSINPQLSTLNFSTPPLPPSIKRT